MGVGVGNYEWWEYFIIPWVAAFVGFGTNVLALQMTFLPLDFWGIPLFRLEGRPWGIIGWQGIIPTKAEKMAGITFDMMTTRLFNIKEIFNRLDAHKFAQEMEDGLLLLMDKVMNQVANEYMPGAWNKLPQDVRDEIIVMTESDEFIEQFMVDLQNHIEDVVDIRSMTIQACVANKPLVNKIFLECGEKVSIGSVLARDYPRWYRIPVASTISSEDYLVFSNHLTLNPTCTSPLGVHIHSKERVLFWFHLWMYTNGNLVCI
jgi:hypothetical protein